MLAIEQNNQNNKKPMVWQALAGKSLSAVIRNNSTGLNIEKNRPVAAIAASKEGYRIIITNRNMVFSFSIHDGDIGFDVDGLLPKPLPLVVEEPVTLPALDQGLSDRTVQHRQGDAGLPSRIEWCDQVDIFSGSVG